MVDFESRYEQVPTIFDDVRKETADYLGFMKTGETQLFSKPIYLPRDEFLKTVKKQGIDVSEDKDVKGLIAFRDGNVYLNHDALNEDLFEQWLFAVLTYFQSYAYVLKETEYGKWISEEAKKGKRLESLGSNLLGGICRAVEIDAIKKYSDYDSNVVEEEIMESLTKIKEDEDEPSKREVKEGYEIIRKIQDKLEKCKDDITPSARERIVKAVLKAAGRDRKFDWNLREIAEWEIHEIYRAAGAKILEPTKSLVGESESLIDEIFKQLGAGNQGRDIESNYEEVLDKFNKNIGGPKKAIEIGKDTLKELRKYAKYNPANPIPEEYAKQITRNLNDLKNYLKKVKKRRRKIDFD